MAREDGLIDCLKVVRRGELDLKDIEERHETRVNWIPGSTWTSDMTGVRVRVNQG